MKSVISTGEMKLGSLMARKPRQQLIDRLRIAGCAVKEMGTDWLTVGNFEVSQAESRHDIESGTNFHHAERLSSNNQISVEVEDCEITALVVCFLLGLFGVSWSIWWIFDPTRAFGWGIFTTLIVGALTYGLAHLASWETAWIIRKTKDWFPVIVLGSCCFVIASLALQYSIFRYPAETGLAFSSHLSDSPFMSLLALGFVLTGELVLELPAIADACKSRTNLGHLCFRWIRLSRLLFVKAIVLAILFGFVFANFAYIDSNLVLFTPKVGLVETRYLIDGQFHVYQTGLATFGVWSQNEKIVDIITPLFPLITESSYSFVTNSTTRSPSILSESGLTVSTPSEDSQGRILIGLSTDSTSGTDTQFSVQFYSEFDVNTLAYNYLSPRIFIRNFQNGTQQFEVKFEVANHTPYKLALNNIMLYQGGGTPENLSLTRFPQTSLWPNYYYNNYTQTFYLSYTVQEYGNLTAVVTYNSP